MEKLLCLFVVLFVFPDLRFLFVFLLGNVGEQESFPRCATSICHPLVLPIVILFSARYSLLKLHFSVSSCQHRVLAAGALGQGLILPLIFPDLIFAREPLCAWLRSSHRPIWISRSSAA
jgi:hypothetical protein